LCFRGLGNESGTGDENEAQRIQKLKEEFNEAKKLEAALDLHTAAIQESLRQMADDDGLKK
jgi:hypothetical protein